MKRCVLLFLVFSFSELSAQQVFWTETFGTGCNTGTLADNETTSNGTWTVSNTGFNGADANSWYISAEENGEGVGNCGARCGSNPTLHIGPAGADEGASYLNGGVDLDVTTDVRAASPVINCSGKCAISLSFEYLEKGDGTLDNHILWYFDGSTWAILDNTPKTDLTCDPEGLWTQYTVSLPPSADNNPDVQIGFQWVNDNGASGKDISVAIYNIQLLSNDTEVPTIDCTSSLNIYLDQDNCEAIIPDLDTAITITVSDNCTSTADLLITQDISPGTTISGHLAQQDVTIQVEDLSGNTNTCVTTLTALDTINPTIICPSDRTQETEITSCDTIMLDYTDQIIWSDNCTSGVSDMTFIQSVIPGGIVEEGLNTITITAIDEAGNSGECSFQLEVVDVTDPVITCPDDQLQYVNSECNVELNDYTTSASVSDNCSTSGNIMVTQSPTPGSALSGVGSVQTVTLSAEDESGNIATCEFQVTVADSTAPVPSCPANDTVTPSADCIYELTDIASTVSVTDNCTSFDDLIITQNPPAGTGLAAGNHVIEINAVDESGNIGTCLFNMEVQDLEAPTITTCAPDAIVTTNNECEGILGDYTSFIEVTDNCDADTDLNISQNPTPGTVISGTTSVVYTVTDLAGNIASCSIQVELVDEDAPTVICPNEFVITVDSNCDFDAPDLSSEISGSDNCSLFEDMIISQDPAPLTQLNGTTEIEVFLEDESGNIASCIVSVVPDDETPPTIDCPTDQVVTIGSSCTFDMTDYTGSVTVSDNCPLVTITQFPLVTTQIEPGATTVLLTATDEGGNESSCSFELFVEENIAPVITCPESISTCDPVVIYTDPVGSDNCDDFMVSQIDGTGFTSGDEFPVGITIQTYEIVDASGNESSCSFEIEVLESPNAASILTQDVSLCDTLSVFLEAENPEVGTGSWSVEIGSATLNNAQSNDTGANNLSVGSNVFIWEVETEFCGSTSDTVIVTVYEQPINASNSDTLLLCNGTLLNVSGNTPNVGEGLWYSVSPGVDFTNENLPNTQASNLESGWNSLVWQISNGSCPASRDTMAVYYHSKPEIITNDTTICISDNKLAIDAGLPVSNVSSGWYFIEGSGTFENQSAEQTTVYDLAAESNQIVYAKVHPSCGTKSDTLHIFVDLCGAYDPLIPTVITPNSDGKNDLLVIENLQKLYPEATVLIVNRWGNLVFESEGYEEPWNGTKFNSGEVLPLGTYFYRIVLNDGSNQELRGPISIIR